jgi:hypothetical protein
MLASVPLSYLSTTVDRQLVILVAYPALLFVALLRAGEVHRQGHHGDLISLNQTFSVLS